MIFALFILGILGRPKLLPRQAPGSFLGNILKLATSVAHFCAIGRFRSQKAHLKRLGSAIFKRGRGRPRKGDPPCAGTLPIEQEAMDAQEVALLRANELLALISSHVAMSARLPCCHVLPSSPICLGRVSCSTPPFCSPFFCIFMLNNLCLFVLSIPGTSGRFCPCGRFLLGDSGERSCRCGTIHLDDSRAYLVYCCHS